MSRHNGLVAFRERVFSRKGLPTDYANIYDANTNVSTRISPMAFDKSVGAANDSGDFTFVGTDGMGTLYRRLENKTYRIYDLLDAAAKAELYSGTTPKSLSEIGAVIHALTTAMWRLSRRVTHLMTWS